MHQEVAAGLVESVLTGFSDHSGGWWESGTHETLPELAAADDHAR